MNRFPRPPAPAPPVNPPPPRSPGSSPQPRAAQPRTGLRRPPARPPSGVASWASKGRALADRIPAGGPRLAEPGLKDVAAGWIARHPAIGLGAAAATGAVVGWLLKRR